MDLYLPLADVHVAWPVLLLLGAVVGTLQGFFGVGGGWLTTPALNILGFPIIYAIGTDLAYTVATAIIGTVRHHRLGNLDVRLALVLGISGMVGIELARRLIFFLDEQHLADTYVRVLYILLLAGVGIAIVVGHYRRLKADSGNPHGSPAGTEPTTRLSGFIQGLALRPVVWFPRASVTLSLWVVAALGWCVGLLAGVLGTGGGFVNVPAMVHVMGLASRVAVAASLFSITLTNSYGTLSYGVAGKVELLAAALMFLGSIVGVQLGATATVYVRGRNLQLLLAVTLILAAVAVGLRQLELQAAAGVVIFTTGAGMTATILWLFWTARRHLISPIG